MQSDAEPCARVCVPLNGENYYFSIGSNFIHATVPHENRPDRAAERKLIEDLCNGITTALGGDLQ